VRLPSDIRFADEQLKKKFYHLENGTAEEKELFLNISRALNEIEQNTFCGIQIPKRLVPKYYQKKIWNP
jgi:hypothetical protein